MPVIAHKAEDALETIQQWKHWNTIQKVAVKEYGITESEFEVALLEYQKFMGLILLGHRELGMFSREVDIVWHSHILHTQLYEAFSTHFFGRMIQHIPNLDLQLETENDSICSNIPCNSKCETEDPVPTPPKPDKRRTFIEAYTSTYGPVPSIWHLAIPDGNIA